MDADLILDKLGSLARCTRRIEEKRPADLTGLQNDVDLQDIISINLERTIQLCVDIGAHLLAERDEPAPETMGEVFSSLAKAGIIDDRLAGELRKAVGFRNLSVHAYASIDWGVVFDVIHRRLGVFREFAAAVRNQIPEPG